MITGALTVEPLFCGYWGLFCTLARILTNWDVLTHFSPLALKAEPRSAKCSMGEFVK